MAYQYPPYNGSERDTIVGYLDYYREVMLDKAGGLDKDQLNTTLGPSNLTLINLIHHLAIVEHWWFWQFFAGNDQLEPWASMDFKDSPDWEFEHSDEFDPEVIIQRYRDEIDRARTIIASTDSLEQLSVMDRNGEKRSMRWIVIHMIEETARHAGHADLIRESIDGETGDFRDEAS